MDKASIDFETRSAEDLRSAGAHRYAAHPSTEVMCMAWSINDEDPHLWHPGLPFPAELADHIRMGGRMEAWNAQFERVIWPIMVRDHGAPEVPMNQWTCTMVRAQLQGFPGKLDKAGPCMGLGECKDDAGHRLMLQVSKPRATFRPGDAGYDETYSPEWVIAGLEEFTQYWDAEAGEWVVCQWWTDMGRITRLHDYCKQDVRTEQAAGRFLDPMPPSEYAGWLLDQRINDRGFYLDMELVHSAKKLVKPALLAANEELVELTGGRLKSITKVAEVKAWLEEMAGIELPDIRKETLQDLLVQIDEGWSVPAEVKSVIELRLAAAKTSTAKLNSMTKGICGDGRIHGGLQYAGAGRTNRWAGRIVQPHNFPRPPKWAIAAVDEVLSGASPSVLGMLYDRPLEVVSAILRSCITAAPGNDLTVADYNAIECRITAWFCGARILLDAYHTGKDPYRMQAASVYGIADWQSIGSDSFERQLGKTIILGCGFGMGDKRFRGSCREKGIYIDEDMAKRSVSKYREDNHEVKAGWYELEAAAKRAVKGEAVSALNGKVWFYRDAEFLRVRLPSGRVLSYAKPWLKEKETPWGMGTEVTFWGWNGTKNRMEWQGMYGGRWMENIVQATARDVMLDSMMRLDAQGWPIILTVHDEILTESPAGKRHLKGMLDIMAQPPVWAPDLPLKAEGWTGKRYRK